MSIHTASTISEVRSCDNDRIEFQEILPLLAVDFVRAAQYTILPFPFKYLTEYAKRFPVEKA